MVAFLLAACGGDDGDEGAQAPSDATDTTEADAPVGGGELSFGVGLIMQNLDPHKERTVGDRTYTFAIFDRLTRLDNQMQLQPMLATEWEFSDDLLTLTMTLRDDVTFHDGTPFDAAAAKTNLERAKNVEGSTVKNDLAQVESVEVVSPTEIALKLSTPAPDLPARLAGPAGAQISPAAIEGNVDISLAPGLYGSGPYIVDELTPSETITLVPASDENWDPDVAPLDKLTFTVMTDPRASMAAVQTGEVDGIAVGGTPDLITQAKSIAGSGDFQFIRVGTGGLDSLLLRMTVPPLDDVRVRQAVAQAIDRDAIVSNVLQGSCSPSAQIFPEGWPGHIDDFEDPYPYDPEQAQKLIDEVGGLDRPLEILVNTSNAGTPVPEAIRAQLSEAGIDAQITSLAPVEALERFRSGNAQAWQFQFRQSYDPAATILDGVFGPQLGAQSDTVQTALDKAQSFGDPEEREPALEDMNRAVMEEAFFVPLCFVDRLYLAADYVTGLETAVVPYDGYTLDVRFLGRSGQ